MSRWVWGIYWVVQTICEHIETEDSLPRAFIAIRVDEPMVYRVVISALEVIEPRLSVVVVAARQKWAGFMTALELFLRISKRMSASETANLSYTGGRLPCLLYFENWDTLIQLRRSAFGFVRPFYGNLPLLFSDKPSPVLFFRILLYWVRISFFSAFEGASVPDCIFILRQLQKRLPLFHRYPHGR